jgi:hypothetical protein
VRRFVGESARVPGCVDRRRMGRRVLHLVISGCLLLGAAVVGLWVRSYWYSDTVGWAEPARGWGFNVNSFQGSVTLSAGWTREAPPAWRRVQRRAGPFVGTIEARYTRSSHDGIGRRSGEESYQVMGPFGHFVTVQHDYRVHAWYGPHAAVAAVVAGPAGWAVWRRGRAGRFGRGRCAACGYDLTGNVSGVCPECGAVTPGGGEGAMCHVAHCMSADGNGAR